MQAYHESGPTSRKRISAKRVLDVTRQLEHQLRTELAVVNGLNVFPVPDGDTGTNMLATVREALRQAECAPTLQEISRLLAAGAMLGARGNSGVILSQFFRAVHEVLQGRADIGAAELGHVLVLASELAYQTVTHPTEGTMLSVMSAAASVASDGSEDEESFLAAVLDAATDAVARTPEQLLILREAQVVDAGGYGFLLLLRGCYEALTGQPAPPITRDLLGLNQVRDQIARGGAHPADLVPQSSRSYGQCVTVLAEAATVDDQAIRRQLEELGESVLVVIDDGQIKVHAHVADPEVMLRYIRALGAIRNVEVSNIDEQASAHRTSACAVVAVASGEGLVKIFRNLGAAAIVSGGPTQNPSTAELIAAADRLSQAQVFLLPNNGNVLAAARQAAKLRPNICVVPSKSVQQGVAAMLSFDAAASSEENVERMTAALTSVVSAELVPAARAARLGGVDIRPGDMMAILEGQVVAAGPDALRLLLEKADAARHELATIYYGVAVTAREAEELRSEAEQLAPKLQIELLHGGQPHAHYLVSLE